tara:strand:- start:3188 stop:3403 length:216 start_codon:yes stop_codon:yes gene_type:complete
MQGKLNINDTTAIICESPDDDCSSDVFVQAFYIRKASKLLTGAPQDKIIPIPIFKCAKCGYINEIFKPKEL